MSRDGASRPVLNELKDCLVDWLHRAENLHGGWGGSAMPSADQRVVNRIR